jgi:hypothetical protein
MTAFQAALQGMSREKHNQGKAEVQGSKPLLLGFLSLVFDAELENHLHGKQR